MHLYQKYLVHRHFVNVITSEWASVWAKSQALVVKSWLRSESYLPAELVKCMYKLHHIDKKAWDVACTDGNHIISTHMVKEKILEGKTCIA